MATPRRHDEVAQEGDVQKELDRFHHEEWVESLNPMNSSSSKMKSRQTQKRYRSLFHKAGREVKMKTSPLRYRLATHESHHEP